MEVIIEKELKKIYRKYPYIDDFHWLYWFGYKHVYDSDILDVDPLLKRSDNDNYKQIYWFEEFYLPYRKFYRLKHKCKVDTSLMRYLIRNKDWYKDCYTNKKDVIDYKTVLSNFKVHTFFLDAQILLNQKPDYVLLRKILYADLGVSSPSDLNSRGKQCCVL